MGDSMENVAVFWDLDTCSIHPSTSGYDVVGKIRALSEKLGAVKSFKGYADLANLGSPQLRSELQSSGLSLIDCPATDSRSISSKTIIVDMLTHAADNLPPTTFLVIAGNEDLAYAVSILRLRQYQVVLVCPKDRVGQHSQASLYLDWFRDVLGSGPTLLDDISQPSYASRHSRSNTTTTAPTVLEDSTPSQDGGDATLPEPLARPPDFDHRTESPSGFPFHEDLDDPIPDYPDTIDKKSEGETRDFEPSLGTVPFPITDEAAQSERDDLERVCTSPPIPGSFLDIRQRSLSAPPSYSSFSPAPSPLSQDLYTSTTPGDFRTPYYFQDQIDYFEPTDETEDSSHSILGHQSPGNTSTSTIIPWHTASAPNDPIILNPLPTSRARLSPDLLGIAVPMLPETSQPKPGPFSPFSSSITPSPIQTPDLSPQIIPKDIITLPSETSSEVLSVPIPPQTPQASLEILLAIKVPSPPPVLAAAPQATPTTLPLRSLTSTLAQTSTPVPVPATASVISGSAPKSTPPKPPVQVRPPTPKVVPSQFKVLVKKLQECREKGDSKPFRPGLAAEMVSVLSGEMREAGVTTFTQFAQLAEQAGVVELPRPGEGLWIALRPELFKYHFG